MTINPFKAKGLDTVIAAYIRFYYVLYVALASSGLLWVNCSGAHPNGRSTLVAFPIVECYGEQWTRIFLPVGLVATMIYTILPILIVGRAILLAPRYYHQNARFRTRYRFLFSMFSKDRFYWGMIPLIRALLIAISNIASRSDAFVQTVMLAAIFSISLALQCIAWPYVSRFANIFESIALSASLIISLAGAAFPSNSEANSEILRWIPIVILVIVNASTFIVTSCMWILESRLERANGVSSLSARFTGEISVGPVTVERAKAVFEDIASLSPMELSHLLSCCDVSDRSAARRFVVVIEGRLQDEVRSLGKRKFAARKNTRPKSLKSLQPSQSQANLLRLLTGYDK